MKTKVNEKVFLKDPDSFKSYFIKEIDTETRMTILIALNIDDGCNCRNPFE